MEIGKEEVLLQSGVSAEIWKLLETAPEKFKPAVEAYFAKGYPGWKVVKANPKTRIVWLKDERRKSE